MDKAIYSTKWACVLFLVSSALSCVYTAGPHVHFTAPSLALDTPLIVHGQVVDEATGEPVPHVTVYLVDVRHENWEQLRDHSARLGTANRTGQIDLAATWVVSAESGAEAIWMPGFERMEAPEPLVKATESHCLSGNPFNIAVVVQRGRYQVSYIFFDTTVLAYREDGVLELNLGTVGLKSIRVSDLPDGYELLKAIRLNPDFYDIEDEAL